MMVVGYEEKYGVCCLIVCNMGGGNDLLQLDYYFYLGIGVYGYLWIGVMVFVLYVVVVFGILDG